MTFAWLLSLTTLLGADSARMVLVAGGVESDDNAPALQCRLIEPFSMSFHPATGEMYFVEMGGHRLRVLDREGKVRTLAGVAKKKGDSGDGSHASEALLNGPHCLMIGTKGDVYVADTWNNRVRKFNPMTNVIDKLAGVGAKGFAGDGGPAPDAKFGGVYSVDLDSTGTQIVVADLDNMRVRVIDLEKNTVRTVAGNGKKGTPKDGADALASPLVDPRAAAFDGAGGVYVLERGGHALRHVSKDGKIRTVAGTGKKGFSGDGGPAVQATMNGPKHLCLDPAGAVLIVDTENHAIRKYDPKSGLLTRVAGTGKKGADGLNGDPLQCQLNRPHGVAFDAKGRLYIADSDNHRIVRIE